MSCVSLQFVEDNEMDNIALKYLMTCKYRINIRYEYKTMNFFKKYKKIREWCEENIGSNYAQIRRASPFNPIADRYTRVVAENFEYDWMFFSDGWYTNIIYIKKTECATLFYLTFCTTV